MSTNVRDLARIVDRPDFRAIYGAPGKRVLQEVARLWPILGGRGSILLDLRRTGQLRSNYKDQNGAGSLDAAKRLIAAGILDGADEGMGGGVVRIRGWHVEKLPRLSSHDPRVGDTVRVGPETSTDVRTIEAVNAFRVVCRRVGAKAPLSWSTERWRRWAQRGVLITTAESA